MKIEEADKYQKESIVFFDGICNFCNATVDWTWRRNKKENILYSSLQSDFATTFLGGKGIDLSDFSTMYFYQNGRLYKRSKAVFRMMTQFSGGFKILGHILSIIPASIADFFYNLIARNRYRIAGKRETCRLPTPEEKLRFLE